MSDKRSSEKLDALRERLYARGEEQKASPRVKLDSDRTNAIGVVQEFDIPPPHGAPLATAKRTPIKSDSSSLITPPVSRRWRVRLLLLALGFFVISLIASSVYLLLGRNNVSGENIELSVTGPFTVGGGEVLSLQLGIANRNNVPVESATLILEYPPGTRSADDESKELFSERFPLPIMAPGEVLNQTFQVRAFGEENQESEIHASIEYRMKGSNATFFKEAAPFKFKIGSAPVVLNIDAEKTISSGQETTITIEVVSNSPMPLKDLLIKAEYPSGFDYSRSDPAPYSGRNIWKISDLPPEGKATIKLTGIVIGTESEKRVIKFAAGVAGTRDANTLASILAVAQTEFVLEQPFLAVDVTVDGKREKTVSVPPGMQTNVALDLKNTLENSVYDTVVEVALSGNALSDTEVRPVGGYYDSSRHTIRWESSTDDALTEIGPDGNVRLNFTLFPQTDGLQTPNVTFAVKVTGRRVSESGAREEISGTISRTIKVESRPSILVAATRSSSDGGPVPPVVGQSTNYTIAWKAQGSANNLSNVTLTTSLPAYITWTGVTSGSGQWNYNPTSRIVEWKAGSIQSGQDIDGTFQVSFLPSASQIDRTPDIIGDSYLSADDSFTGTVLRSTSGAVTSEIGDERRSGVVQAN
ncbi:hypothetical protein A2392_02610 [Candidatus Kaiserbacteria bacterium RIFOXYB1_FULL_46_14]|uniref:DUF11 domain-containing protein n=1 Tax=Candidatus Kaiserbacteria bacterium RIFOXYB1_FULL_46_14 TaxID=1798531 RepID=A0A1F6FIE5_9BACT|nr:MAG: hypothetical protein A2392_02610 [Candidatus Kaiserbacteria bacterium RIFOXYB1_FULL_46_14]